MIGGGMSEDRGYSLEVARQIDEEVREIIETGKTRAREILTSHRTALDAVAKRLLEVELHMAWRVEEVRVLTELRLDRTIPGLRDLHAETAEMALRSAVEG